MAHFYKEGFVINYSIASYKQCDQNKGNFTTLAKNNMFVIS